MTIKQKFKWFIDFAKYSVILWVGTVGTMVLASGLGTCSIWFAALSGSARLVALTTMLTQHLYMGLTLAASPPVFLVGCFASFLKVPKRIYKWIKRHMTERMLTFVRMGAEDSAKTVIDFIRDWWPYMLVTFYIFLQAFRLSAKKLEAKSQYYSYSALFYALFGVAVGVASALFGANVGEILNSVRETSWIKQFVDALINGWESFRNLFPSGGSVIVDGHLLSNRELQQAVRDQRNRPGLNTQRVNPQNVPVFLQATVEQNNANMDAYVRSTSTAPLNNSAPAISVLAVETYLEDWGKMSDKLVRKQMMERIDNFAPFYLPGMTIVADVPTNFWEHPLVVQDDIGREFMKAILTRTPQGTYLCSREERISLTEYDYAGLVAKGMFRDENNQYYSTRAKAYSDFAGYTPFQAYFLLLHTYLKLTLGIPPVNEYPQAFIDMFSKSVFTPYIYMLYNMLNYKQRKEMRYLFGDFFVSINPTGILFRCLWTAERKIVPMQPFSWLGANGRMYRSDDYDVRPWNRNESSELEADNHVLEAYSLGIQDKTDRIRTYIGSKFATIAPYYTILKKLGMISLIVGGFGTIAGIVYTKTKGWTTKAKKTTLAAIIVIFVAILYVMFVEIPKWRTKREQKERRQRRLEASLFDVSIKGAEFIQVANEYWGNQKKEKHETKENPPKMGLYPDLFPLLESARLESNYPPAEKKGDEYENPEMEEEFDRLEEEFYRNIEDNVADMIASKDMMNASIRNMISNARTSDDFRKAYLEIEMQRRKYDQGPEKYAEELILNSADKALNKMKKVHSNKSPHFQSWLAQGGGQHYKRGKRGKKIFSNEAVSDLILLHEARKTRTVDPSYLAFFKKFLRKLNDQRMELDTLYKTIVLEEEKFFNAQKRKETEGWILASNKTTQDQNQQQRQGHADNGRKPSRKEQKEEAKIKKTRQQEINDLNDKLRTVGINPVVSTIPKQIKHGTARNEFILEELKKKWKNYEKQNIAQPVKKISPYKETKEFNPSFVPSPSAPPAQNEDLITFEPNQGNIVNQWKNGPPSNQNQKPSEPIQVVFLSEPPEEKLEAPIRSNMGVPSTAILNRLTFDDPQGQVWKAGFRVGNFLLSCAHPQDFKNYPVKCSVWQGTQKIVHADDTHVLKEFPDLDLSILKLKGETANKMRSLKMKTPQMHDQVTIVWSKQGTSGSEFRTSTGKVVKIIGESFYYDVDTDEGASGSAVMDREGKCVYGIHLSSDNNERNRGIMFTPEVIKLVQDFVPNHLN